MGIDVIHIGLATTPTTEIAVVKEEADGGIILTASHNPKQWNALKLLNHKGEFLTADDGSEVLTVAEAESFDYADVDELGIITEKMIIPSDISTTCWRWTWWMWRPSKRRVSKLLLIV